MSEKDPRRREIFMNIPAVRPPTEQSFEVHGNVVLMLREEPLTDREAPRPTLAYRNGG